MSVTIKENAAVGRLIQLLAVSGKSGDETAVAELIQTMLLDAGVPQSSFTTDRAHRTSPAGGDMGNLIVRIRGRKRSPRRLLMAHLDTVPLAVGCEPVIDGKTIRPKSRTTALGGDNRAGCAVILTAVVEALAQGLPTPPVTLLFTVQEEIGLCGARHLAPAKLKSPELCFNWDGRDPAGLIRGAVGASNLEIQIQGIASHAGGHPEDGVNAAVVASLALADLQKNGWHGLIEKDGKRGASNLGVIEGGAATNVVMPEVRLVAEVRSHQAAFRRRVVKEWKTAFEKAVRQVSAADGRTGSLSFEEDLRYNSFRIPARAPCVLEAAEAVKAEGFRPDVQICDGGLDANWMAAHGFPVVTLGCGQHNIHTVDEFLEIEQYLAACRIGLRLLTGNSAD